jgi:hypothetical protein
MVETTAKGTGTPARAYNQYEPGKLREEDTTRHNEG